LGYCQARSPSRDELKGAGPAVSAAAWLVQGCLAHDPERAVLPLWSTIIPKQQRAFPNRVMPKTPSNWPLAVSV